MRLLVTGGAGYIGSITTRVLLDVGHECVVLDTLENGWREAVDPRAAFVEGSTSSADDCAGALTGCDAVVHLAGYIEVAESKAEPEKYLANNAEGPCAMLDAMAEAGVRSIVYSSTAAVYGEPATVPITEDVAEAPINPYGESKLRFERELVRREAAGELSAVRFRYFNVAGAWPDGSLGEAHDPESHLIPRILRGIAEGGSSFEVFGGDYPTRDGTCVRDYVHVCDLARAHLLGLERLRAEGAGGVFNLGNGEGFTNLEVVRTCAEVTGRDIEIVVGPRREGDPATLVASSERARTELGWRRERGELATMIADAWRWHLAHPDGYR